MEEIIPLWLVNLLAFTTIFSVMASIGTTITPSACLEHMRSPRLLGRGLFSALVFVPAVAISVGFVLGLSLPEKVGVTLIAIAPGAPLALRRALGSGGHGGFAPTLQVALAMLAIPVLPLWVVVGNWILGTHGIVDLAAVARQVFLAQLLPLGLGASARSLAPVWGPRLGTALGRAGALLLVAALVTEVVNLHKIITAAHQRPTVIVVAIVTTLAAIAMGHVLGGALVAVRHSIAIASALRNIGLALLVADTNKVPAPVQVALIIYALTAIVVVSVYIFVYGRSHNQRLLDTLKSQ